MAHSYRKSTIKITFQAEYARPRAYEVELFLRDELHLDPQEIIGIQFSIAASVVYVKMINEEACTKVITGTTGRLQFRHSDGHIGDVTIDHAGLGMRTLRVFELPFEVPADSVTSALKPYGNIISHVAEKWQTFTTYPVLNGVRQVKLELTKHVPSYLNIAGCRAIIMYDGQPRTCSGCGQEGHVRSECMQRRITQIPSGEAVHHAPPSILPVTYAHATAATTSGGVDQDQIPPQTDDHVIAEAHTALPLQKETPDRPAQRLSLQGDSSDHTERMDVDPRVVPTQAFLSEGAEGSDLHSHSDTETHVRKQRSPRKHKKRRRTPSDDSLLRTDTRDRSDIDRVKDEPAKEASTDTASSFGTKTTDSSSTVNPSGDAGGDGSPTLENKAEDPLVAASPHRQPLSTGSWADDMEDDSLADTPLVEEGESHAPPHLPQTA